ncbi:MAG TPA: efflux RND transporter periplasmic adaptor subunit [Vicinamibacterales bacterium]|jgi:HlyD family secretion protein|nr:efflux RND transporter periplasmic adaptor subunit [Vicinamibacterales bacterium]
MSLAPVHDLERLRIDRDAAPRRPWLLWTVLALLVAAGVVVYPRARAFIAERQAPEVEIARATQVVAAAGGSTDLPVLVATGYVVARHSSEVGVKVGGRLARLKFEEGTRVRKGEVMAEIEHADIDAQLEASRRAVAEADAQLVQAIASRDEDTRSFDRQRALMKDGITTDAALTAAQAAAAVSAARVKSAEAAIASARARVRVTEEALENTNVRAPFDGVVIKKRAEVGETVSPFGVQGQSSREGGAIATIADLGELEVQTEVSENSVAKLTPAMPAEVKLQAYQEQIFKGRLRQIFPSADRAKAIVEVRVTILNADDHVKPEMTASVTFQEKRVAEKGARAAADPVPQNVAPVVLIPKRTVTEQGGQTIVWVVTGGTAARRPVKLGRERLDQVEAASGVIPGEALILNPPPSLTDRGPVRVKGK